MIAHAHGLWTGRGPADPARERDELHVLMELSSCDLRMGAVNDAIDLAELARPQGVRFTFCGPLDARFAAAARDRGAATIDGRSRAFSRSGLPLYMVSVGRWLGQLATLNPDIVHLNYAGWGPSLGCAASLSRVPVVARAGGAYHTGNPANAWVAAYAANCAAQAEPQLASPLADRVVVTGDLFRPDRVRSSVVTGARQGSARTRPRILYLGQLVERKGLHVLVEAFARVGWDCELWLVGGNWAEGSYAAAIKQRVAELGLGDRVRLENHREDVAALMQSADVFVLPSLSEARPRSIIEAMFMGLPVVGSRVGGIPSLVEDGVTGALVAAGDPAALATALQSLVGSAARRRQLGAAGLERAEADCRPDRTAGRYIDMYRAAAAHATLTPRAAAGAGRAGA